MFARKFETRRSLRYLFNTRVMFFSFGKYWKGVYIHFLPERCHRIFWSNRKLQHDSHLKPSKRATELMEQEHFNKEQDKALETAEYNV